MPYAHPQPEKAKGYASQQGSAGGLNLFLFFLEKFFHFPPDYVTMLLHCNYSHIAIVAKGYDFRE